LGLKIEKKLVIINRAETEDLAELKAWEILLQDQGLTLLGVIPKDEMIYAFDKEGKPTSTLPENSTARAAAFKLFDLLF
jgi:CO dehydrogenase maturation factor